MNPSSKASISKKIVKKLITAKWLVFKTFNCLGISILFHISSLSSGILIGLYKMPLNLRNISKRSIRQKRLINQSIRISMLR